MENTNPKLASPKLLQYYARGKYYFYFYDLAQIIKNKVLFFIISVCNKSYQAP